MHLEAIFLITGGLGKSGILIYLIAAAAIPLSIFWQPRIGVYILVPLMPLQTVRYQLHVLPLGDKLVDLLLISIFLGLIMQKPGSFPPKTGYGRIILILSLFCYVSLWMGSAYLHTTWPLSPSDVRFADWKNMVEMPLLFLLVTAAIETKQQMKMLLLLMVLSILRVNLGFYHTVSGRDFSYFAEDLRYAGVLGYAGKNGLAAFQAEFLLFCLGLFSGMRNKGQKALLAISMILTAYCVLFTFSRGAYLGFLAGLLCLGILRERKYLIVVAVILIGWQSFVPPAVEQRVMMTYENGKIDSSANERVQLWEDAITLIPQHPVLGTGFDTYRYLGRSEDYTDTHNYYVKVMVETGFVGLTIFLVLLWKMFRSGVVLMRTAEDPVFRGVGLGFAAMMVCVSVVNLFGDRWMYQQLTAYMWVFLALVTRAIALEEEASEPVMGVTGTSKWPSRSLGYQPVSGD
ncbi:MAG: O-antigen ligase family protein [Acidobacteriaceae bacterium]